ncbi:MAG: hypothetical protein JXQ99_22560 [Hyphomicrobiaceae bacterium]
MSNPAFQFDHVHILAADPHASANGYVEMFGATISADTVARGAPQIFVELGGATILIRGKRPGEMPAESRPIESFDDFSSHNAWGTDHFGFMYDGDLKPFRLRWSQFCSQTAADQQESGAARSGAAGKPFDTLGGRRLRTLRAGRICPDLGASRLVRSTATHCDGPLDLRPNPPRQNGSI